MTTIHSVKPETLLKWLQSDQAVLIDVREPAEYNAEYIEYARNLPLSQVTIEDVCLTEHKNKKLVIQCVSGKRSMMACEKLKKENAPFDIWSLEGGIASWKEAGLETKNSGKKMLPLDRQVQLSIGLMILTGMALGLLTDTAWFILPVITGFGLVNAGLTGWCGLAKLMAKMPWNKA